MNWKVWSLLALVALAACVISLYLNHELFGSGPVTIAIQACAAALMIWARITFGMRSFHGAANPTAGGLVRNGPYKYIRHPIYAAILYFLWAGIAAHPSLVSAATGLFATLMLAVRIIAEEKLVMGTYPEYREYARTTSRIVPFIY